jgi:hypothetical protein
MELKYKNQPFQSDAVQAIVDVFEELFKIYSPDTVRKVV